MKTAEELNALKEELETLNKLHELTADELEQVNGGIANPPGSYGMTDT